MRVRKSGMVATAVHPVCDTVHGCSHSQDLGFLFQLEFPTRKRRRRSVPTIPLFLNAAPARGVAAARRSLANALAMRARRGNDDDDDTVAQPKKICVRPFPHPQGVVWQHSLPRFPYH